MTQRGYTELEIAEAKRIYGNFLHLKTLFPITQRVRWYDTSGRSELFERVLRHKNYIVERKDDGLSITWHDFSGGISEDALWVLGSAVSDGKNNQPSHGSIECKQGS